MRTKGERKDAMKKDEQCNWQQIEQCCCTIFCRPPQEEMDAAIKNKTNLVKKTQLHPGGSILITPSTSIVLQYCIVNYLSDSTVSYYKLRSTYWINYRQIYVHQYLLLAKIVAKVPIAASILIQQSRGLIQPNASREKECMCCQYCYCYYYSAVFGSRWQ